MKKLIITLAAVVCACGMMYADLAYDFTASLKTTAGKYATTKQSYSINLGYNSELEQFWYTDTNVVLQAALMPEYFTTKVVSGTTVPALTAEAKKDGFWLLNDLQIVRLASTYDEKSAGKWCESFKFTATYDNCYRVYGTKKIKKTLYVDDSFIEQFTDTEGNVLRFDVLNRFGSASLAKSTKIDSYGCYNDTYTLAGQGTFKDKLVKINSEYVPGIYSISGYIVGTSNPPACTFCCASDMYAWAWPIDAWLDIQREIELLTAEYGSWTLKFNKKATLEINQ